MRRGFSLRVLSNWALPGIMSMGDCRFPLAAGATLDHVDGPGEENTTLQNIRTRILCIHLINIKKLLNPQSTIRWDCITLLFLLSPGGFFSVFTVSKA